jgi:predicted RNase H-like HicB family nuclease
MDQHTYQIDALWDPDTGVWVATSDEVPGLATEADSLEELTRKLRVMAPELLEANKVSPSDTASEISFEVTGRRRELVKIAC